MTCSYPNCPCGYKSPLCDEYPPQPSQPQPAESSAVEQARQRVIDLMADALGRDAGKYIHVGRSAVDAMIAAVRAESCPACAEKTREGQYKGAGIPERPAASEVAPDGPESARPLIDRAFREGYEAGRQHADVEGAVALLKRDLSHAHANLVRKGREVAEKDQQLERAEAEITRLREVFRMCRNILGY